MEIKVKETGNYGIKKYKGEYYIYSKEGQKHDLSETVGEMGYSELDICLTLEVPDTLILYLEGEVIRGGHKLLNKYIYHGTDYNDTERFMLLVKLGEGSTKLSFRKGERLMKVTGYFELPTVDTEGKKCALTVSNLQ